MTTMTAHRSPVETSFATKQLGNSDLWLTPIGFGAWAIGGGNWDYGWGPQDDRESVQAIVRAIEGGVNWIDTAAIYGLGRSEEVVARALAQLSRQPYVFTKCSMRWDRERKIYRSLKKESVREEVENSLRRLQLDTIDLYQVHWPDPEGEIEEGWTELASLKQEGKLRWIGVSNFSVEQIKRVQKIAPVTSLQPPFSLLHQQVAQEVLPYCRQQGIGVINYSPMASGLLTGRMTAERIAKMPADDWRQRAPHFREPALSRNLKLVEVLRAIGREHDVEPGVVAIAWTLHNPAVTAAIVGARRADQVDGILPAAEFRLSNEEAATIDSFLRNNPV
ncbi:MAG: aldo/keto reductase [Acidobacteriota bacterium]|nr:aldo/keto reductase [Acidobacteriota bacterium]